MQWKAKVLKINKKFLKTKIYKKFYFTYNFESSKEIL